MSLYHLLSSRIIVLSVLILIDRIRRGKEKFREMHFCFFNNKPKLGFLKYSFVTKFGVEPEILTKRTLTSGTSAVLSIVH